MCHLSMHYQNDSFLQAVQKLKFYNQTSCSNVHFSSIRKSYFLKYLLGVIHLIEQLLFI